MKKYFLTGLAILLPISFTIVIIVFFVDLLTKPFLGAVSLLFSHYITLPHTLLLIISKILILLLLTGAIAILGSLARVFVASYLLRNIDRILHKIPVFSTIYKGTQEAVAAIFSDQKAQFYSVVLAPYPQSQSYMLGLVTSENYQEDPMQDQMGLISVYLPGAPIPTFGFTHLFKREQLIFIDMKVEDALKYLISCGVMLPPYTIGPGSTVCP